MNFFCDIAIKLLLIHYLFFPCLCNIYMFILPAPELCLTSECSYVWWFLLLDISNIRDMSCHQTMHDLIHLELKKKQHFSNSFILFPLHWHQSRALWHISAFSRSLNQAFMEPWMFTLHRACGAEWRAILPKKNKFIYPISGFHNEWKIPPLGDSCLLHKM